jgi:sugar diacid utilization regulator
MPREPHYPLHFRKSHKFFPLLFSKPGSERAYNAAVAQQATLVTFFAEGRRHRSTADALCIHTNTFNYRLEHIESLLGASLDDAEWIAKLDIALKLRRLIPTPTGP